MRKNIKRLLAAILVAALLIPMLAGCRRSQDNIFGTPEFVFLPEIVSLPDEVQYVSNLIYSNDRIFFMSEVILNEMTWETELRIYSMNTDGTNLTRLENFTRLELPQFDQEGVYSWVDVRSIIADSNGSLWVFENWQATRWEPYEQLGQGFLLSKLDDTGAKISSIDLSALVAGEEFPWIDSVVMDSFGNIYVSTSGMSGLDITVLDTNGDLQFKIADQPWGQLLSMSDGRVALAGYVESIQKRALRPFDHAARAFGDAIPLPDNAWDVYPGTGDYSVIFRTGNSIFGFISETEESVRLLNWLESNIIPDSIGNLTVLPDGRIICTNWSYNMITGRGGIEVMILSRIPYSDLPVRTIITLASAQLNWSLLHQIVQFNRTSLEYRIQIIDYSDFNTDEDRSAAIRKLSTDIIAGNIPDILDVSNLPVAQYAARGLLEDLYTFIDADPELSRSGLVEAVLKASEFDGKLVRMFPSFIVNTVIGHPSVVGPGEGWNMAEFRAVLDANPRADKPMGEWLIKTNFLEAALMNSMDQYIDWETGRVHFDTGDYAQLLEFANMFPDVFVWDDDMMWEGPDQMIANGRQIMMQTNLWDFESLKWQRDMFGGEIVFKGFPTDSRQGSSFTSFIGLAITTRSNNKDGAWEFLREFLTSDWQRANFNGMPVNKEVFDEMAAQAMVEREGWNGPAIPMPGGRRIIIDDTVDDDDDDSLGDVADPEIDDGWDDGWWFPQDKPLTQQEVDQIINLINSITNFTNTNQELMFIIMEDASDFFNGRRSAQDTARITQSRVSRLIAEQS